MSTKIGGITTRSASKRSRTHDFSSDDLCASAGAEDRVLPQSPSRDFFMNRRSLARLLLAARKRSPGKSAQTSISQRHCATLTLKCMRQRRTISTLAGRLRVLQNNNASLKKAVDGWKLKFEQEKMKNIEKAKKIRAPAQWKVNEALVTRLGRLYESLRQAASGGVMTSGRFVVAYPPLAQVQRDAERRVYSYGEYRQRLVKKMRWSEVQRPKLEKGSGAASRPAVYSNTQSSENNGVCGAGQCSAEMLPDDDTEIIDVDEPVEASQPQFSGALSEQIRVPETENDGTLNYERENGDVRCQRCNRIFKSQVSLVRHASTCNITKSDMQCEYCKCWFRDLRNHHCPELRKKGHHKPGYACNNCGAILSTLGSLRRHKEGIDRKQPCSADSQHSSLRCPLCVDGPDRFVGGQEGFVQHLNAAHGYAAVVKRDTFASKLLFDNWLLSLEKGTSQRFVINTSYTRKPDHLVAVRRLVHRCYYWRRHDDAIATAVEYVPDFGLICPAFVVAVISKADGSVQVVYCTDHCGHDRYDFSKYARHLADNVFDFMADFLERHPDASNQDIIDAVRGAKSELGDVVMEYSDQKFNNCIRKSLRNPDSNMHAQRKLRAATRLKQDSSVSIVERAPTKSAVPVQHQFSSPLRNTRRTAKFQQTKLVCPPGFAAYAPRHMRVIRQLAARRGECDDPAPLALELNTAPGAFLRMTAQPMSHAQLQRPGHGDFSSYGCYACGRHAARLHKYTGRVFYSAVNWQRDKCTRALGGVHPSYSLQQLAWLELELAARRALAHSAHMQPQVAAAHARQLAEQTVVSVAKHLALGDADIVTLKAQWARLSDDVFDEWRRDELRPNISLK